MSDAINHLRQWMDDRVEDADHGEISADAIRAAKEEIIEQYKKHGGLLKDFNPLYGEEENAAALDAYRKHESWDAKNAKQLVASTLFGYSPRKIKENTKDLLSQIPDRASDYTAYAKTPETLAFVDTAKDKEDLASRLDALRDLRAFQDPSHPRHSLLRNATLYGGEEELGLHPLVIKQMQEFRENKSAMDQLEYSESVDGYRDVYQRQALTTDWERRAKVIPAVDLASRETGSYPGRLIKGAVNALGGTIAESTLYENASQRIAEAGRRGERADHEDIELIANMDARQDAAAKSLELDPYKVLTSQVVESAASMAVGGGIVRGGLKGAGALLGKSALGAKALGTGSRAVSGLRRSVLTAAGGGAGGKQAARMAVSGLEKLANAGTQVALRAPVSAWSATMRDRMAVNRYNAFNPDEPLPYDEELGTSYARNLGIAATDIGVEFLGGPLLTTPFKGLSGASRAVAKQSGLKKKLASFGIGGVGEEIGEELLGDAMKLNFGLEQNAEMWQDLGIAFGAPDEVSYESLTGERNERTEAIVRSLGVVTGIAAFGGAARAIPTARSVYGRLTGRMSDSQRQSLRESVMGENREISRSQYKLLMPKGSQQPKNARERFKDVIANRDARRKLIENGIIPHDIPLRMAQLEGDIKLWEAVQRGEVSAPQGYAVSEDAALKIRGEGGDTAVLRGVQNLSEVSIHRKKRLLEKYRELFPEFEGTEITPVMRPFRGKKKVTDTDNPGNETEMELAWVGDPSQVDLPAELREAASYGYINEDGAVEGEISYGEEDQGWSMWRGIQAPDIEGLDVRSENGLQFVRWAADKEVSSEYARLEKAGVPEAPGRTVNETKDEYLKRLGIIARNAEFTTDQVARVLVAEHPELAKEIIDKGDQLDSRRVLMTDAGENTILAGLQQLTEDLESDSPALFSQLRRALERVTTEPVKGGKIQYLFSPDKSAPTWIEGKVQSVNKDGSVRINLGKQLGTVTAKPGEFKVDPPQLGDTVQVGGKDATVVEETADGYVVQTDVGTFPVGLEAMTVATDAPVVEDAEPEVAEEIPAAPEPTVEPPAPDATRPIGAGVPPASGVVVANIGADGKIYYGKPGETHADLSMQFGAELRESEGLKPGEGTWDNQGFADNTGRFLSREEALEVVRSENQGFQSNLGDELDAADLAEQGPRAVAREVTDETDTEAAEPPTATPAATDAPVEPAEQPVAEEFPDLAEFRSKAKDAPVTIDELKSYLEEQGAVPDGYELKQSAKKTPLVNFAIAVQAGDEIDGADFTGRDGALKKTTTRPARPKAEQPTDTDQPAETEQPTETVEELEAQQKAQDTDRVRPQEIGGTAFVAGDAVEAATAPTEEQELPFQFSGQAIAEMSAERIDEVVAELLKGLDEDSRAYAQEDFADLASKKGSGGTASPATKEGRTKRRRQALTNLLIRMGRHADYSLPRGGVQIGQYWKNVGNKAMYVVKSVDGDQIVLSPLKGGEDIALTRLTELITEFHNRSEFELQPGDVQTELERLEKEFADALTRNGNEDAAEQAQVAAAIVKQMMRGRRGAAFALQRLKAFASAALSDAEVNAAMRSAQRNWTIETTDAYSRYLNDSRRPGEYPGRRFANRMEMERFYKELGPRVTSVTVSNLPTRADRLRQLGFPENMGDILTETRLRGPAAALQRIIKRDLDELAEQSGNENGFLLERLGDEGGKTTGTQALIEHLTANPLQMTIETQSAPSRFLTIDDLAEPQDGVITSERYREILQAISSDNPLLDRDGVLAEAARRLAGGNFEGVRVRSGEVDSYYVLDAPQDDFLFQRDGEIPRYYTVDELNTLTKGKVEDALKEELAPLEKKVATLKKEIKGLKRQGAKDTRQRKIEELNDQIREARRRHDPEEFARQQKEHFRPRAPKLDEIALPHSEVENTARQVFAETESPTSQDLSRIPGAPKPREGNDKHGVPYAQGLDRDKSGKAVAPTDYATLKKWLQTAIDEGAELDWYSNFGSETQNLVGDANMNEFAVIFGITSAKKAAEVNFAETLHIMDLARRIDPNKNPEEFKQALWKAQGAKDNRIGRPDLGAKGTEPNLGITQKQVDQILDYYKTGQYAGGLKVSTYMWNVIDKAGNNYSPFTVQDVHMSRVFGWGPRKKYEYYTVNKKGKEVESNFKAWKAKGGNKDGNPVKFRVVDDAAFPRDKNIRYAMYMTSKLAGEFGITPQQAQAGLWFYAKNNLSPKEGDGLEGTWESTTQFAQKGIARVRQMIKDGEWNKDTPLYEGLDTQPTPFRNATSVEKSRTKKIKEIREALKTAKGAEKTKLLKDLEVNIEAHKEAMERGWSNAYFRDDVTAVALAQSPQAVVSFNPGQARGFGFPKNTTLEELVEYQRSVLKAITDDAGRIRILHELGIPHTITETMGTYERMEPSYLITMSPGTDMETVNMVANLLGDAMLQDAAISSQPDLEGPKWVAHVEKSDGTEYTQDELEHVYAHLNRSKDPEGKNFTLSSDGRSLMFLDDQMISYQRDVSFGIPGGKDRYSDADTLAFYNNLRSDLIDFPGDLDIRMAGVESNYYVSESEEDGRVETYQTRAEYFASLSGSPRRSSLLLARANDLLYKPAWSAYQEHVKRRGYEPENNVAPRIQRPKVPMILTSEGVKLGKRHIAVDGARLEQTSDFLGQREIEHRVVHNLEELQDLTAARGDTATVSNMDVGDLKEVVPRIAEMIPNGTVYVSTVMDPALGLQLESVGDSRNSDNLGQLYNAPDAVEQMQVGLSPGKAPKIQTNRSPDLEGQDVGLRIDIPFFKKTGEYVVTVHKGATKSVGPVLGYDSIARLSGAVQFQVNIEKLQSVHIELGQKTPFATVAGSYAHDYSIPADLDTAWTPVGFDPAKAVFFYDKRTGQEVVTGTDAVSVGNTVFTRNPQYGERSAFNESRVAILSKGRERTVQETQAILEKHFDTVEVSETFVSASNPKPQPLFEVREVNEYQPPLFQRGDDSAEAGPTQETRAEAGELSGRGELPRGAEQLSPPYRATVEAPPLEGLPTDITVKGADIAPIGPHLVARVAAARYMQQAGLPYNPPTTHVRVDRERAARIADVFDKATSTPSDPATAASYRALIEETQAQWEVIRETGLQVEWITEEMLETTGDPYAASPRLAIDDIVRNNHFWCFPTDLGFGSDETFDVSENPLFAKTGEVVGGKEVMANDIFRIVHDYFGHAKEGNGFRANGEENAWRSHVAMYSDLAKPAMTSETRGQNSWVNFGPNGEFNRTASAADTVYADQKVTLMPEWVVEEGSTDPLYQRDEATGPLWYSKARKIVEQKMGKRGSAEQVLSMLKKNGVKPDELEWSGLEELLGGGDKSVTREEVLQAIDNGLQMDEVVKGLTPAQADRYAELTRRRDREGADALSDSEWSEFTQLRQDKLSTGFTQYTLPGGKHNVEIMLTLPQLHRDGPYRVPPAHQYGDEADDNRVVHVRMNEHTGADGKRVLFVEEVQSDWHQDGRKIGYARPTKEPDSTEIKEAQEEYRELFRVYRLKARNNEAISEEEKATLQSAGLRLRELLRQRDDHRAAAKGATVGVPDAPFKSTSAWAMLGMKRAIQYAVDNGFDRIAWTTGEQQAKRWGKLKEVDELVLSTSPQFPGMLLEANRNGVPVLREQITDESQIEKYLGKEAAERLVNADTEVFGDDTERKVAVPGLKVGSEKMKAFYDTMLPSAVNKFIKKFGAKVGTTMVSTGIDADGFRTSEQPAFDITPEMRDSALREGQPLFQKGDMRARGATTLPGSRRGSKIRGAFDYSAGHHRAVIGIFEQNGGDFGTLIHELGHFFRTQLTRSENIHIERIIEKETGKPAVGRDGRWTVAAEEFFAEQFQRYVGSGKTDVQELQGVFAKLKRWLSTVIFGIKNKHELSPEVRSFFDSMLSGEERTALSQSVASDRRLAQAIAANEPLPEFAAEVDAIEAFTTLGGLEDWPGNTEQPQKNKLKFLQARGNLPRPVWNRLRKMRSTIAGAKRSVELAKASIQKSVKQELGGMDEANNLLMNDFLSSPEESVRLNAERKLERAAPKTLKQLRNIRTKISAMSQALIDAKILDEEKVLASIDANLDIYLNRSYRFFEDQTNWTREYVRKNHKELWNDAVDFVRSQSDSEAVGGIVRIKVEGSELPVRARVLKVNEEEGTHDIEYVVDGKKETVASNRVSTLDKADANRIVSDLLTHGGAGGIGLKTILGAKNLDILKKRKEIPVEIRRLWGEYENVDDKIVSTMFKMQKLMAEQAFLKDLRDNATGTLFFEEGSEPVKDEVTFPPISAKDNPKLGPLQGLRTYDWLLEELERHYSPQSEDNLALDTMKRLSLLTKVGNTVYSVGTQLKNFVSNVGIQIASGNWDARKFVGAGRTIIDDWANTSDADRAAYIKELYSLGVIDGGVSLKEVMSGLDDASASGIADYINKKPGLRAVKKGVVDVPMEIYKAGDTVWRIYAFENFKKRYRPAFPDMEEADLNEYAAQLVYEETPSAAAADSSLLKLLRGLPMGSTFITFTAEMYRVTGNQVRRAVKELASDNPVLRRSGFKRLLGLSAAMDLTGIIGWGSVNALMGALLGAEMPDDDEQEDYWTTGRSWFDGSQFLKYPPIFKKNEKGEVTNVILRQFQFENAHSYGGIRNVVTAVLRGVRNNEGLDMVSGVATNVAGAVADQFLEGQMATELVFELMNNRDDYGNEIVKQVGDDAGLGSVLFTTEGLNHVLGKTFGGVRQFTKLVNTAYPAKGHEFDHPEQLRDATLSFFGMTHNYTDLNKTVMRAAGDLKYKQRNATKGAIYDVSKGASPEEAYGKANEFLKELEDRTRKVFSAAERLGMSPEEIDRIHGVKKGEEREISKPLAISIQQVTKGGALLSSFKNNPEGVLGLADLIHQDNEESATRDQVIVGMAIQGATYAKKLVPNVDTGWSTMKPFSKDDRQKIRKL